MTRTDEPLNRQSLEYVEKLYGQFLHNPASLSDDWRQFFSALQVQAPAPAAEKRSPAAHGAIGARDAEIPVLQQRVDELIRSYRERGHLAAELDPLNRPRPAVPELDLAHYGLTAAHLDRAFSCDSIPGAQVLPLHKILEHLRRVYCGHVGIEYLHIDDPKIRDWLRTRLESNHAAPPLSPQQQVHMLQRLTEATTFEEFIQHKFTGAKSFSLEGAASLTPLLDHALEQAGADGVEEVQIGMAHRGRLNVLANVMRKPARHIFHELAHLETLPPQAPGDVQYHLGYESDWTTTAGHKVHLRLCYNASHLEFRNPVTLGRTRSRQDRFNDTERRRVMALLIHGDAAFAGEGIVQETLNFSQLAGYRVGGTLHVVLNNQLGFTTLPEEGRSGTYATDVARMLSIPIFHVNGGDPEAVVHIVRLAMEFRRTFARDVVIDLYCYRRRGHNEGDEPSFTQPQMYRAIEQHQSLHDAYLELLLQRSHITRQQADDMLHRHRQLLEQELEAARQPQYKHEQIAVNGVWSNFWGGAEKNVPEVLTGVEHTRLTRLLELQSRLPENFHVHPRIQRPLDQRLQMARGERPLDWSAAEALAFASLATDGFRVRLTGQDCARGTFSQRHAVFHDYADGHTYMPLQHLDPRQAPVEIHNSPLSEAGVLGFEYGYSLDWPDGLILWEAQFGDFANAAQVIIDQFLASAERKWSQLSGLVLLLPHAFEGMGPEHSSARLERFLALAADDNMQVANPTTPAQYFHLLRRQVLKPWRKPLVLMTPKSLLRHPQAVSGLNELAQGGFQRVIPDTSADRRSARHILLCSGKIYYDLLRQRDAAHIQDVPILRLEQYYPLPTQELQQTLADYPEATPVLWVQEEPENMGAWRYLLVNFGNTLFGRPFSGLSRPASASPGSGSAVAHRLEQKALVEKAFELARQPLAPAPETVSHDNST